MIYYCTRLRQAQPDEREIIEKEMASQSELHVILEQLTEVEKGDNVVVSVFEMFYNFQNLLVRGVEAHLKRKTSVCAHSFRLRRRVVTGLIEIVWQSQERMR